VELLPEWEVEYTDEFEEWWNSLTEEEQEDVDAKVTLLQRLGPRLGRPHSDVVRNTLESLTGCFTPLTRVVLQFCLSEARRLGTRGGTKNSFRSRIGCTTSILPR